MNAEAIFNILSKKLPDDFLRNPVNPFYKMLVQLSNDAAIAVNNFQIEQAKEFQRLNFLNIGDSSYYNDLAKTHKKILFADSVFIKEQDKIQVCYISEGDLNCNLDLEKIFYNSAIIGNDFHFIKLEPKEYIITISLNFEPTKEHQQILNNKIFECTKANYKDNANYINSLIFSSLNLTVNDFVDIKFINFSKLSCSTYPILKGVIYKTT